jgi:hypothetical protein
MAPGMNSPAGPATSRAPEPRAPKADRLTNLSGRLNAGLVHRTERELLRVREPALAWHKDLGAAPAWHKDLGAAPAWHKDLGAALAWHKDLGAALAWHKDLGAALAWH